MKQLLPLLLAYSLQAQVSHIHCGGLIVGVQNRTLKEKKDGKLYKKQ